MEALGEKGIVLLIILIAIGGLMVANDIKEGKTAQAAKRVLAGLAFVVILVFLWPA